MSGGAWAVLRSVGSGNVVVRLGFQLADVIKHTDLGSTNSKGGIAAVAEAFENALGACATEGQLALVNEIGITGFEEGFSEALDNGRDATGVLTDMTNHPEAIGEILAEAEDYMTQAIEAGRVD